MVFWILHHLLLIGLLLAVTALCIWFPAIALKWKSPLVAIVICALFAQWMFDKGVNSESGQVDAANAKASVAVKEAAQGDTSATVTAAARTQADTRLYDSTRASARTSEAIHERIRQAPAAVGPDPAILRSLGEARARAEAAADSVRGTPPRGSAADGADQH
jgi:hypothetical protein